jgi:serine/threonine-protein kinase HipA
MIKTAALNVSYNNEPCGYLAQFFDISGKRIYMYTYTKPYLSQKNAKSISLSLPLREDPYYSKHLFGFFDNLLSEGWLKREQAKLLDISEFDHFSLLAKNGADMAGAVTVSFDEKLSDLLEPYFRNI